MNYLRNPILALSCTLLMTTFAGSAGAEEKMVIELKTTDFELTETDISSLAVGESKTVETESGKVIDILRTADGAEIYIDGELLDINQHAGGHKIKKQIEVTCEDETDCEREVVVIAGHDGELTEFIGDNGDHVIIHKEIIMACNDDEGGTRCSDENVWVSEDGDIDVEVLHDKHSATEGKPTHKVIIIEKEIDTED